uniref:hypothetical protein n=1 Tax=Clostridium sp. NkU-1 TaxID=1095009 RepID=UPI00326164CF
MYETAALKAAGRPAKARVMEGFMLSPVPRPLACAFRSYLPAIFVIEAVISRLNKGATRSAVSCTSPWLKG